MDVATRDTPQREHKKRTVRVCVCVCEPDNRPATSNPLAIWAICARSRKYPQRVGRVRLARAIALCTADAMLTHSTGEPHTAVLYYIHDMFCAHRRTHVPRNAANTANARPSTVRECLSASTHCGPPTFSRMRGATCTVHTHTHTFIKAGCNNNSIRTT